MRNPGSTLGTSDLIGHQANGQKKTTQTELDMRKKVHSCTRVWEFPFGLRKTRPPTGVFGPFGPEVHLGVSERVSPKIGVCPEVSGEVPLGVLLKVT